MNERSAAVSVVGGNESNPRDSMQSEDVVKCLHVHVTCGNSQILVCKILCTCKRYFVLLILHLQQHISFST